MAALAGAHARGAAAAGTRTAQHSGAGVPSHRHASPSAQTHRGHARVRTDVGRSRTRAQRATALLPEGAAPLTSHHLVPQVAGHCHVHAVRGAGANHVLSGVGGQEAGVQDLAQPDEAVGDAHACAATERGHMCVVCI